MFDIVFLQSTFFKAILPYYIACLNIEQTYAEITGTWREFGGACFVDTLENWGFELTHRGAQSDLFGAMTEENRRRIQNQNTRRIPVIIGNPPYNANQKSENDNNKNLPSLITDARIRETYIAESAARKTKLYDPFIRFFRWASDRIGAEGMIGFITNRSFIDKYTFDGFRKTVASEFQEIWLIDLKGDSRASGDEAQMQGGNIFNIRLGVAIAFLVRNSRGLAGALERPAGVPGAVLVCDAAHVGGLRGAFVAGCNRRHWGDG